VNTKKEDYTYDGFGNTNTISEQVWDGSSWYNNRRWEGVFYGFGMLQYETNQNGYGSSWEYTDKKIYTYNVSWYLTKIVEQIWGGTDWQNQYQRLYTYDLAWNEIELLSQEWKDSDWTNWYKDTTTWDAHNNKVERLIHRWDEIDWVNDTRYLYTYLENTDVVEEEGTVPETFALSNYPNPFNSGTTIRFELPKGLEVTLAVYDVNGRLMRNLISGERYEAGAYWMDWNGTDSRSRTMPSGVYLVRMESGVTVKIHRCMLVK
jgi:hypothetical protein